MTRRQLLAGWGGALARGAGSGPKPNVLLINTDDQRFDTIRALGNREIQTPVLDRLVRGGFHFTNFYSQGGLVGAMCLPSRTMLMTGRSVFRIPQPKEAPDKYPILAKAMEAGGYSTFHVGKRGNTYFAASRAFQKCVFSEELSQDRVPQSRLHADAVIDFVKATPAAQPFFAYMAPSVPHDPRVAEERFMKMYDPAKISLPKNFMPEHPFDNGDLKIRDEMLAGFPRKPGEMRQHLAEYYACITGLDYHMGRVLDSLRSTGRLSNTIVIFTSDQGLAVGGRHGLMGKQNLYEHFKGPLVFNGPGIGKGRSEALVHMHDLFPSICSLTGVAIPKGVEGADLAPVIRGEKEKVRDHAFAVYKDVQRMTRDSRYKLIWYPQVKRYQLFDLKSDPWELKDLSGDPARAQNLAELKQALARQMDEFSDVMKERPV